MKRVLVVSFRFPPQNVGGVIRGVKFMKYLARHGWKVDVMVPSGSTKEGFESDLTDPNLRILEVNCPRPYEKIASIAQKWRRARTVQGGQGAAPASGSSHPSFVRRVLALLKFPDEAKFWNRPLRCAIDRYFQEHPSCDVIFSHGPPFSPFIALAAGNRKWKRKLVLDFRDVWSDDPDYEFPFEGLRGWIQKKEKLVVQSADRIVATSEGVAEQIQAREASAAGKIAVIANGFDPEDAPVERVRENPKRFRIVHAGSLFGRDPAPFLEGWKRFLEKGEGEVVFYGPPDTVLAEKIASLSLQKSCRMVGKVPHGEMVQAMAEAAVFLMVLQHGKVYEALIPGKIYEYAAFRRPILAFGPEGLAMKRIEGEGWGSCFSKGATADEVAGAIAHYYREWREGKLVPFGGEESLKRFSREELTRKLEEVLAPGQGFEPR